MIKISTRVEVVVPHSYQYEVGTVVAVHSSDPLPYRVRFDGDDQRWSFDDGEIIPVPSPRS